jgi:type VI secretion system protein ImpE
METAARSSAAEANLKLDEGDLAGAIAATIETVKKNPTDVSARIFLFELSAFSGDWDRAEKQLDAIGHQNANSAIGSVIYRQNFQTERDRINVFEHSSQPGTITNMPDHVGDLVQAVDLVWRNEMVEARTLLDKVEEERPAFAVEVDGERFEDFRDYNDLTMCVFEVFLKGNYVWLPFEEVVSIEFLERKSLRDIYWPQAQVELANGSVGEMFFPALYVNSWKSSDDQVRLGRAVDWRDLGDDVYVGEGARLFWMDGQQRPMLDIKKISFITE